MREPYNVTEVMSFFWWELVVEYRVTPARFVGDGDTYGWAYPWSDKNERIKVYWRRKR